jgi:hypothetical protein
MLQQYKVASYSIIVALVAVLFLFTTVTAKESVALPQGQQGMSVIQDVPGPDTRSGMTISGGAPSMAPPVGVAPQEGIAAWARKWVAILATKCAIPAGWHHVVECDKYYATECAIPAEWHHVVGCHNYLTTEK